MGLRIILECDFLAPAYHNINLYGSVLFIHSFYKPHLLGVLNSEKGKGLQKKKKLKCIQKHELLPKKNNE